LRSSAAIPPPLAADVDRLIAIDLFGWDAGRNLTFRGGSASTPSTVSTGERRRFGGPKVSGCSHGLVGRRSDVSGGVDQAAAGWFGERDELVGRDLLWSHPPHSLKPGLALLDGDLGFALGSHRDSNRPGLVVVRGASRLYGSEPGEEQTSVCSQFASRFESRRILPRLREPFPRQTPRAQILDWA
jgi:hypothetical protein